MGTNCIQEGDKVILRRNGACRSFQIRKNRQLYFEKHKFSVDELVGQPYGSKFELDRGKLVKLEIKSSASSEYDTNVQDPSTDNRDLRDADSNQKMSKEDIMKMKEEGITGEKIIEELVENSETFKNKTEFSQAKYLKKKKNKHIITFSVLRPTPRLVLEIFAKEPQKICNLRADTLSQMLSFGNVMSGSNVTVVETCQGLLLSCILHRLGGQGKIIQLIPNSDNPVCRQVVDFFSFTKEELDNVYTFPMSVLNDLKKSYYQTVTSNGSLDAEKGDGPSEPKRIAIDGERTDSVKESRTATQEVSSSNQVTSCEKEKGSVEEVKDTDDTSKGSGEEVKVENVEGETTQSSTAMEGDKEDSENATSDEKPFVRNRDVQRRARAVRHKEAADLIMSKSLDCLMVACKYNPTPIVKKMLEFMPPSRSVVVFCPFVEPLVEIYTHVKDNHLGLQVKLSETWLREYQVLPQRTHPMMSMSGNGGYLLSFITSEPSP